LGEGASERITISAEKNRRGGQFVWCPICRGIPDDPAPSLPPFPGAWDRRFWLFTLTRPVLSRELSGYNQTVKYDKLGQIRREVSKVGAKSGPLLAHSLGLSVFAFGLGAYP